MKTSKRSWIVSLMVFLLVAVLLGALLPRTFVKAKAEVDEPIATLEAESDETQPLLFTTLTLYIEYSDGFVYGIAKNSFTLFPSKVSVRVELRGSETYYSNTDDYPILATAVTSDLNMGKKLKAGVEANVTRYYVAFCTYVENGTEKTMKTGVVHLTPTGEEIN